MDQQVSYHLRSEAFRFLIGGFVNTALSLLCYWALLPFVAYGVAYTLSFVLGVFSSYAINTYFVFRTTWSWKRLLTFPLVHVVNYCAGLFVVWLSIRIFDINAWIAPLIAIAATLPLNFILSRWVIRGRDPT